MIATKYKRPQSVPEKNSGELLVEKSNYLPAARQIENLMRAGIRLHDSRREQFDYDENGEQIGEDPTRQPNYDMADASQELLAANARIKAQQEEAAKKAAEKLEAEKIAESDKKEPTV